MVITTTPLQLPYVAKRYELLNEGNQVIYYGNQYVSAANKLGEIKPKQAIILEGQYYVVAAAGQTNIELQSFAIPTVPNIMEWGAKGDNKTDDTSAINAAIQATAAAGAVGPTGGEIHVPGNKVFLHEGEINFKSKQGIYFQGEGGLAAGAGIGAVGSAIAPSIFIYGGTGARGWDFRKSLFCGLRDIQCFAWGPGFTGAIWDCSGTETEPCQVPIFIGSRAECTAAKPGEIIVHGIGLSLDYANQGVFDYCTFASCLEGVQGINNPAHSSVAHSFRSCIATGSQFRHFSNPQEDWTFDRCVGEGMFNDKGIPLKSCTFIGCGVGMLAHGVNVLGCWAGSNEAATRTGSVIEARGDGWNIQGNSLNTAENGVYFPEGPVSSTVMGNRFWKVSAGILITGKTVDSLIMANKGLEVVNLITDTINERKGSIVQTVGNSALLVS